MLDRLKTSTATFCLFFLLLLLLSWAQGRDERDRLAHQCNGTDTR